MRWIADLRRLLNGDVRGVRDDNAVCLYVAPLESRRVLSASPLVAAVDPAIDGGLARSSETLITAAAGEPVFEVLSSDLRGWVQEDYQRGSGTWSVDGIGATVTQESNGQPTVFYSDFAAPAAPLDVMIRVVGNRDDDYIGFVLGFQPGDFSNADADYLLVDWRQADGIGGGVDGLKGLAVSHSQGDSRFTMGLLGPSRWRGGTGQGDQPGQPGLGERCRVPLHDRAWPGSALGLRQRSA